MSPVVELIRLEESFEHGTFGVLLINKEVFCVTLEPADRENQTDISSIPAQQYICKRHASLKYGSTFQVMNVPGRQSVLFHAGNIDEHTKGCILLGEHFGKLKGNRAILNSGNTYQKFLDVMKNEDEFHLTIREEY